MSDDLIPWLHDQMCRPGDEAYCGCAKCARYAEAAAEIRSLRARVAQERAGIVRWLRAQVTCGCGRDDCIADNYPLAYADAIEAQQDKEPQT